MTLSFEAVTILMPWILGLVYTSSYCRTKPNIVKFGNGTVERHFDLYVEPVSNSIYLIVIYGACIHAKFGKFVRSNKMAPVHEQKWVELVLFKLIKTETSKDEVAAAFAVLPHTTSVQYSGGCSVHWRDSLSTVGDSFSTVEVAQYSMGIHQYMPQIKSVHVGDNSSTCGG